MINIHFTAIEEDDTRIVIIIIIIVSTKKTPDSKLVYNSDY